MNIILYELQIPTKLSIWLNITECGRECFLGIPGKRLGFSQLGKGSLHTVI